MKRAEIAFKHGAWILTPFDTHDYKESSVRIRDRRPHGGVAYSFSTHEAALAHALHEVGLAPGNPEPMEAP